MLDIMLSRRQINVQRENLITICRISVKALIDFACLNTHVDDGCEEFINFCAAFEQLVSHRLRPNQKKAWLPRAASSTPRHFWDVLLDTQSRASSLYFQSCVPNIDAIESFKSPQAKLRAFFRVALMEKRLSDYIMWVLDHQLVLRNHYFDGAVMLSEQAAVLCGDLIGLNAIDFNFCLKGNENEFLGPLEISYFKYLGYKQSAASQTSDEIEMLRLNQGGEDEDAEESSITGKSPDSMEAGSILTEGNINDILRLQQLEKDFRSIKEQKDYLEELTRLRERQVSQTNARLESVRAEMAAQEAEWDRERRMMDSCILELQADITKLFQQNERLRFQVASYRQFKDRLSQREVQLDEMAMTRRNEEDSTKFQTASIASAQPVVSTSHRRQDSQLSSDLRSLHSMGSEVIKLPADSHSMVPLTGSLAGDHVAAMDSGSKESSKNQTEVIDIGENAALMPSGATPIDIGRNRSVSKQEHPDSRHQETPGSQSGGFTIMMESFVVTENRSEIEMAVKHALASHSGAAEDIVAVQVAVADGGDDVVPSMMAGGCDEPKVAAGTGAAVSFADEGERGRSVVRDGGEDEYDDIIEQMVSKDGDTGSAKNTSDEEGTENKLSELTVSSASSSPSPVSSSTIAGPTSTTTEVKIESDILMAAKGTKETVEEGDSFGANSDLPDSVVTSEPEDLALTSEPEDLALTSEPEDLALTSEPEDLVLTSEPELLDNGNTSSDSSDVAWDMLPDSDQVDVDEGKSSGSHMDSSKE